MATYGVFSQLRFLTGCFTFELHLKMVIENRASSYSFEAFQTIRVNEDVAARTANSLSLFLKNNYGIFCLSQFFQNSQD